MMRHQVSIILVFHDQPIVFTSYDEDLYHHCISVLVGDNKYITVVIEDQDIDKLLTGFYDMRQLFINNSTEYHYESYFDDDNFLVLSNEIFSPISEEHLPEDGFFIE